MIEYEVLFTKFGKSGKPRLSMSKLKTGIIDIDSCGPASTRKVLKELSEEYLLPPYEGNYKSWRADSKIQKVCQKSKNLAELETWDFMAYVGSLSTFLCRTISNYGMEALRIQRDDIRHIPANEIPVHLMGHFACYAFNMTGIDVIDDYRDYFSVVINRKRILEQLCRMMCLSRRSIIAALDHNKSKYKQIAEIFTEIAHGSHIKIKIPMGE